MSSEETALPAPAAPDTEAAPAPAMSKNALKRLRREQKWEDRREDRKRLRREKRIAHKARVRDKTAELIAQGADPAVLFAKKTPARLVPVSLILDCQFEEYMSERELVSLSSQVTRCYSDNRNFTYKSHFWISGWGGKLRERFDGAMEKQHLRWKGVGFEEGDFQAAALKAREAMKAPEGGEMIGALQRSAEGGELRWEKDKKEPFPLEDGVPDLDERYADVVYLTSESPYTLERLEPNTCYVIGGLVDKNREKGLCYKRAVAKGVRTAKLPIGQYMKLRTRQILATNHVVEIMLRWLECEDWAEAFSQFIPKRKGGKVIGEDAEGQGEDEEGEDLDERAEDLEGDEEGGDKEDEREETEARNEKKDEKSAAEDVER